MSITKIVKPYGSLMQDKRNAECSTGAFFSTFVLHSAIIGKVGEKAVVKPGFNRLLLVDWWSIEVVGWAH